MLRVFLLLNVAAIAVLAKNVEECHQLLSQDAFGCCKVKVSENQFDEKVEGCESKAPPDCEEAICTAKKLGLTTADDGTFDKNAMEEYIKKKLGKSSESADSDIKTCIYGDLSSYGSDEHCDIIKMKQCFVVNYLSNCPDWEETDVCSEVKMFIDQCS